MTLLNLCQLQNHSIESLSRESLGDSLLHDVISMRTFSPRSRCQQSEATQKVPLEKKERCQQPTGAEETALSSTERDIQQRATKGTFLERSSDTHANV